MANLITYQQISTELKSVGELRFNCPRVVVFSKQKTKQSISDLISKTNHRTGYKPIEGRELALMVDGFFEEIKNNYDWITFTELEIAFNRGYREAYGTYTGLNIKTFCGWLDGFYAQDRGAEMEKRKPQKAKELPEITQSQSDAQVEEAIESLKARFKTHKSIPVGSNYIYDYLAQKGRLDIPLEREKQILEKAKSQVEVKLELVKNRIKHLHPDRLEAKIKSEYKRIALFEYLEKL